MYCTRTGFDGLSHWKNNIDNGCAIKSFYQELFHWPRSGHQSIKYQSTLPEMFGVWFGRISTGSGFTVCVGLAHWVIQKTSSWLLANILIEPQLALGYTYMLIYIVRHMADTSHGNHITITKSVVKHRCTTSLPIHRYHHIWFIDLNDHAIGVLSMVQYQMLTLLSVKLCISCFVPRF